MATKSSSTATKSPSRSKQPTRAVSPAQTIVKKRSYIVPIVLAVVVLAAILFFTLYKYSTGLPSDGSILAVVNGEPIYQKDIQEQYQQLPAQYREQYTESFILNQTVERTLLLQEAKKRSISADDEEVDAQIKVITSQFGLTEGELYQKLQENNITVEKYRGLVREEVLLNKIIQEEVLGRVTVSDEEILEYYENENSRFSAPKGGVVLSHILVANETLAKEIIKQLTDGASFDVLAEKYSMDSSASAGGYLGIVTQETPFVEPFKTEGLKLREGQFTRSPVQTQFGYHVIFRGPDREPFKQVRSRIQAELKAERQLAAYQAFTARLRSEATIKYYTKQGVVSTPPAPTNNLDSFATCVGGKATLYGTQWSDFFKEQKEMFKDSFNKLIYVDCDEKPQLCAAAKVQKYPTWVIADTDEHLGKMSLKELAAKTGCELPD